MTERIEIVVTEKGSRVVTRNLKEIGDASQRTSRNLKGLSGQTRLTGGAFDVLGRSIFTLKNLIGSVLVIGLGRLVDSFTNIQNRLRNVTEGTGQLGLATEELFDIANRTRSAFESTAEVFARTALALKDLGVSQRETLTFTESLNQAVILSGASAQEANAGLIQLSQGLASGTLRGDELRSVLEQLPAVADVVARGLGVTRGELRRLGEEGKITAKDILTSFAEAREELAERFARTIPTIGQSLVVLRNNLVEFVGGLDQATGASSILARTILTLANNMETLGRITGIVAVTIGTVFARQALAQAIIGVRTLTLLLVKNPFTALALGAVAATAALFTFGSEIAVTQGSLTTIGDVGRTAFDFIGTGASFAAEVIQAAFSLLNNTFGTTFDTARTSFRGILTNAARLADGLIGIFRGTSFAVVTAFAFLPGAINDLFAQAINGAIGIVESGINRITQALNSVLTQVGSQGIAPVALERIRNDALGNAASLGGEIGQAFTEGFEGSNFVAQGVDVLFDLADLRAQQRIQDQLTANNERRRAEASLGVRGEDRTSPQEDNKKTFEDLFKNLEQENVLLRLNSRERKAQQTIFQFENQLKRQLTSTEQDLVRSITDENRVLQTQADLLEEIRGPQMQLEDTQQALNVLFEDGKITIEEYNNKLRELELQSLQTDRTLQGGIRRGLLQIQDQFGDIAQVAENTLVNAFRSAEDALVEFVTTGKTDFKSLVDSIFADLTRLAVRQSITAPLANLIGAGTSPLGGSSGGGIGDLVGGLFGGGGIGNLLGFQNGGEFTVGPATSAGSLNGVDNRLVAFRAQDGERVSISRRGENPNAGRPVQVTMNIQTPNAESFERSQSQILARTQAGLQRANRRNN